MGYTTGQVAMGFGKTPQTIRDWIKNPVLHEFFSPSARRDSGHGQAELFAADVEVCNSIHALLGQGIDWVAIAEKLRTGWRNNDLPDKFMVMDDDPRSPSNVMLMAKLAAAHETIRSDEKVEQMLLSRIDELKAERESWQSERNRSNERIEDLNVKLAKALMELELWNAGRLTPPKAEG